MTTPDDSAPLDATSAPQARPTSGAWPPAPGMAEAYQFPEPSPEEAAIEHHLNKAQGYYQYGWMFYPLYIAAMVHGLKANRLGAQGQGTKYIVAGAAYIVIVSALLIFLLVMILLHTI